MSPFKVVIMDSKRDSTLIESEDFWEEGYLAVEAANRLNIFYLFEDIAYFTDRFIATIKIIKNEDLAWKDYIRFLDLPIDKENYPGWARAMQDPLFRMAAALVSIHVKNLKDIVWNEKDFKLTIDWTWTFFKQYLLDEYHPINFSEQELQDWIRERQEWLPLELAQATMAAR